MLRGLIAGDPAARSVLGLGKHSAELRPELSTLPACRMREYGSRRCELDSIRKGVRDGQVYGAVCMIRFGVEEAIGSQDPVNVINPTLIVKDGRTQDRQERRVEHIRVVCACQRGCVAENARPYKGLAPRTT